VVGASLFGVDDVVDRPLLPPQVLRSGNRFAEFLHQQLHVLPGQFLGLRCAQQIGGMVGDQDLGLFVAVETPPQSADAVRSLQDRLGGDRPPADDVLGLQDLKLAFEVGAAVFNLQIGRRAIAWGAALQRIHDVDLLPTQP